MKRLTLALLAIFCFVLGTTVFAAVSGFGSVAAQVTTNLGAFARFITAASYVAGMAFAVGAIIKFKAHKDNPTQIPLSTGIVLLFVGIALIFIPTIFKVGGSTMFASGGRVAGVSGITNFGAQLPSG